MAKILQTFDDKILELLNKEATRRGISKQELIRCVIVPDWLKQQGLAK
ncbi:MAG: ribbon-helix-helix protein, CopG family [Thermoplasmata archaeon]|nr:ribbon-helix-helix protein, CopG family [Thermoplasmata archaeon]